MVFRIKGGAFRPPIHRAEDETLKKIVEMNFFGGAIGSSFAFFLRKFDLKTCIATLNPEFVWFDRFYLPGDLR